MIIEAVVTFAIILAGVWFLTEVLQKAWYESVVTSLTGRVVLASAIFTAVQLYGRLRLESILAEGLPWLIASGIVWVLGFLMILQFAASHAIGLGLAAMLILTNLSGMAADGLQPGTRPARINTSKPAKKSVRTPRYNSAIIPFQQPNPGSSTQAGAQTKSQPAGQGSPK